MRDDILGRTQNFYVVLGEENCTSFDDSSVASLVIVPKRIHPAFVDDNCLYCRVFF
jgi:hypothetical protein